MPHVRLPGALARFNRHVTNPIMGTWAPYLPPWAIIEHRGRKSGKPYRTVVFAFVRRGTLIVVLTYGETDWLRNVQAAGQGGVTRLGRSATFRNPRVVQASEGSDRLTFVTRLLTRVFGSSMIADLDRR